MYKVNSNGNVYFADTVLPIIVADNGCYILSEGDTGGICHRGVCHRGGHQRQESCQEAGRDAETP